MSRELREKLRLFLVSILVDAAKEVLPMFSRAVEASSRAPATLDKQEGLLRPREAAKLLSISERSLWSMMIASKIPYVRIGRLVRYDPAALRRWINDANSPEVAADASQFHIPSRRERQAARGDSRLASKAKRRTGAASPPNRRETEDRAKVKSKQNGFADRPRDVVEFFAQRLGVSAERFVPHKRRSHEGRRSRYRHDP